MSISSDSLAFFMGCCLGTFIVIGVRCSIWWALIFAASLGLLALQVRWTLATKGDEP